VVCLLEAVDRANREPVDRRHQESAIGRPIE
jgi:hypothetical protein